MKKIKLIRFLSFFSMASVLLASDQDVTSERKRLRDDSSIQVYAIPTYDAAFKWILSDDTIRPSFFSAFVPDLKIMSSRRLDDHMNPIEDLQLLRTFLHGKETEKTVDSLTGKTKFYVVEEQGEDNSLKKHEEATSFLHDIIGKFDDLKKAFPKVRYNGTMDFVCQLENKEYAMIEMQVIPQDYWDRRALAYVAAFYGNQLRRGQEWKDIKKVIGINILGGGKDHLPHWKNTPDQFVRHYKFQEQIHRHSMFIDGIELWQYSIMNAPPLLDGQEQEKQDWITFLKSGHYMSEKEVKETIKTEAVLKAFERAKIDKLPEEVQTAYEAEDKEYERFSEFTKEKKEEGIKEGERKKALETAKNLKQMNLPLDQISKATGLSVSDIEKL